MYVHCKLQHLLREDDADVFDGVGNIDVLTSKHLDLDVERLVIEMQSVLPLILLQVDTGDVVLGRRHQHVTAPEHLREGGEAFVVELEGFRVLALHAQGLAHVVLGLGHEHVLLTECALLNLQGTAVVRKRSHALTLAKEDVRAVHHGLGHQHMVAAQNRFANLKRFVVHPQRFRQATQPPERHSEAVLRAGNLDVPGPMRKLLSLERRTKELDRRVVLTAIVQQPTELALSSADGRVVRAIFHLRVQNFGAQVVGLRIFPVGPQHPRQSFARRPSLGVVVAHELAAQHLAGARVFHDAPILVHGAEGVQSAVPKQPLHCHRHHWDRQAVLRCRS
mmetsp:Transcript_67425/g.180109  ORF Transcript_67425/g.180109 Transcript_67425/m.180109 type:complete len:335 (-) Transcript_67425:1138-2142(-)